MPTRFRKVRKFRGGRSHGWGQSAGHRGAGSHGGFGKTGGHKHMWTYIIVHEPERFGKHGFYHYQNNVSTMNVGELNQLIDNYVSNGKAEKKEEGVFIDLSALGVEKLLGTGHVDKQLIVKVKAISSKATKKFKKQMDRYSK